MDADASGRQGDSLLAPFPFGLLCVEGSALGRVIRLMERLDYKLVGAEGVDHLSRTVLHFDAGKYLTTLTWEDKPKPGQS